MESFKSLIFVVLFAVGCSTGNGLRERPNQEEIPSVGLKKDIIDPSHFQSKADYHFTLGNTLSLSGQSLKAIRHYKLALIYDPHAVIVKIKLAVEYIKQSQFSEALEEVKEVIAMDPDSIEARLLLGGIYSSLREYERAEENYLHILKLNPGEAEAALSLGSVLAEQKKYVESLRIFQKVAENHHQSYSALAYYYMGRVSFQMEKKKQAIGHFKKSVEIKPDFSDAALALAKVQYSLGYENEAVKGLAHFQKTFGPEAEVAKVLSRFYEESKEYDKAYKQYEIIVKADPEQLNILVKMALISLEQKQYYRAVEELEKVLTLSPDSDKIRFFLAATYEEMGKKQSAAQEFQKIPKESSFYDEAIVRLVQFYTTEGDLKKAENIALAAIRNRPDVPKLYYVYNSFIDNENHHHEIINLLIKVTQRLSENSELQFLLGTFYDKVDNKPKVISHMKKAISLNKQFVRALNYLAYTYAEMEMELNTALELAQRAIQLKPKDGHIKDTLGWVLYKQGDYEGAVKALETAYRLNSTESIIAEHLGDAYYQYSYPHKAKKMYRKAVQLERDTLKIQNLKLKITSIESEVANRASRGLSSQSINKSPKQ